MLIWNNSTNSESLFYSLSAWHAVRLKTYHCSEAWIRIHTLLQHVDGKINFPDDSIALDCPSFSHRRSSSMRDAVSAYRWLGDDNDNDDVLHIRYRIHNFKYRSVEVKSVSDRNTYMYERGWSFKYHVRTMMCTLTQI